VAGQITKRGDNRWLVRVQSRDARGHRHSYSKVVFGTKKAAEKHLAEVLHKMHLGTFFTPSEITLDEYLDQWLDTAARPSVSKRTASDYGDLLRRYIRKDLGTKKLAHLRPLDIQRVYGQMQERGLSSRTVQYTHAVLSSALKQAVKWGMISQNPAALVELPRKERKEMLALSQAEAARFLTAAAEDRLGFLFAFALTTGLRPEEYLGMQWKDVDLARGVVTVQRTLVWRPRLGGWYFGEPKTSRSRRSIPLPASIVRGLAGHKQKQLEQRSKAGEEYVDHDLVFTNTEGGPLKLENLRRRHFHPILERAQLPKTLRLYDLRHTCATLLLAANEHPKVVSERLGHASVTMTLDVYSHVLPTMQQAASDKLEEMLFGAGSRTKE
jgi:integrase